MWILNTIQIPLDICYVWYDENSSEYNVDGAGPHIAY